jgi:hypothetical protein
MHGRRRARRRSLGRVLALVGVGVALLTPSPAAASSPSSFCRAVSQFNAARPPSDQASISALKKLAQASPRDVQRSVNVIIQTAKRTDATTALLQAALPSNALSEAVTVAGNAVVQASNGRCHIAVHFGAAVPTGISQQKVKPADWVRNVCATLASWGSSLRDAGLNLATPGGGLTTTLPTERGLIQQFVSTAVTRTAQLLAELNGAGTPSAPQGAAYTAFLHDGVAKAHQAFVAAQPTAATLADDVHTFQTQAQALVQRLDTAGKGVEALVREADAQIGDRVLVKAFAAEPTCGGIA